MLFGKFLRRFIKYFLLQVCGYVESPISDSKVPYIVDVLPVLRVSAGGPQQFLREALARWGEVRKPHIVADSAFGSLEMLEEIVKWGGHATLACSPTVHTSLWETLSLHLQPNSARACIRRDSRIAASIRTNEDLSSYQRILSSSWEEEIEESETEEDSAEDNSDSVGEDDSNHALEIEKPVQMPLFIEETLSKKTVKELREICRLYAVKTGKKKRDIIDNILQRSTTVNKQLSDVEAMVKKFEANPPSEKAPMNDFYRLWFNLVDLSDRRWYSVEECHKNYKWQSKMLYALLRYGIMNCWVMASGRHYQEFINFRDELITLLFNE